jgi:integrase
VKSLSRQELTSLVAVAQQDGDDMALMIRCCFNHGLRVSELLSLTKDNIVGNMLVVQRLKGSNQTCQPLLADEKDGLLNLAKTDGLFFPMSRWTFNRWLKTWGAKAGIEPSRLHAHVLKHSAGRIAYLGGMGLPELQTYLGHVSGSSTMVYVQSSESEAAAAFAAAIGGQSFNAAAAGR